MGGTTYDMAAAAALQDVATTGSTLVPPYDDPRTMAGQGTIAVELLDQLEAEPDLVIVPVGGGGCISGITTYLAERAASASVLGVEPAGAASMIAALATGHPVTLDDVDQFIDGAAAVSYTHLGQPGRPTSRALARAKLVEIDAKIAELARARGIVEWAMECTCPSIDDCTCGIHPPPEFVSRAR